MIQLLAIAALLGSTAMAQIPEYYAPRFHDHGLELRLRPFANKVISEGRIEVYELHPGLGIGDLPKGLAGELRKLDLSVLADNRPDAFWMESVRLNRGFLQNPDIRRLIEGVTESSYRERITSIVNHGNRATLPQSFVPWALERFTEYGYAPFYDYNIVAHKVGDVFPDEHIILIGHMDTVNNTVGADDNASGAAAVLEAARVLGPVRTKRSITFILSEDEEIGLLGAKHYIRRMREDASLAKIKFVINMDMIGYNSNGIFDLETAPEFESYADQMAETAVLYTNLTPNKVLNPWGSDHVPFIDANIPAVLTIENWSTHTPCWHRSCDTLATINFAYASEITRLNIAALAERAELLADF